MLDHKQILYYPSSEELPDSDETPVDNELQELLPGLLKAILLMLWENRMDWFFGIDMGIYYHPDEPPIVPDGFLSLGVERFFDEELRLSYPLWEENVTPILALEIVSQSYRGEYTLKKEKYAKLKILYYAIYSSRRRKKPHLEVHKLINGVYELQSGHPVFMPEIGLGIGAERGNYGGVTREWLYWYDENGKRILTPEERVKQSEERIKQSEELIKQSEKRTKILEEKLRSLGINPDSMID